MTNREAVLAKYPRACAVPSYATQKSKFTSFWWIQTNRERYLPTRIGDGLTADDAWAAAARRIDQPMGDG